MWLIFAWLAVFIFAFVCGLQLKKLNVLKKQVANLEQREKIKMEQGGFPAFRVMVDGDKSNEELLKGYKNWQKAMIDLKSPRERSGKHVVNACIIEISGSHTVSFASALLKSWGYRGTTVKETLTFGVLFPELVRNRNLFSAEIVTVHGFSEGREKNIVCLRPYVDGGIEAVLYSCEQQLHKGIPFLVTRGDEDQGAST